MPEKQQRQLSKPEIAAQRKIIKLAPAIGDWTTYKPPKVLVKKVKTGLYGFDRLSKNELNLVLQIHYRFIQKLLKQFRVDLGMAVELFSVQTEQTTYLNFLRTLMGSMVQLKITIPGMHDSISLFLELPLANSIINYSLGSIDLEPIDRALTEAEQTTLSTTLTEYLPIFRESFENTMSDLTIEVVSSPDVIVDSTISPASTLASFSAETSLADNSPAKIYIAYQGNTLKTLLENYQQKELSKQLNFSRLPTNLLAKITSPVASKLGETTLTTAEIGQLEVGDVVSLETAINSSAETTLGNILELSCQPGSKAKKAAIRVLGLKEAAEVELAPPELALEEKPKSAAKVPPPSPPKPKEATKPIPKPVEPLPKEEPLAEEKFPEDEFGDEFKEDFPEDDLFEDDFSDEEFPEDKL